MERTAMYRARRDVEHPGNWLNAAWVVSEARREDFLLCAAAYGVRASSFGSPFGLAQDFASWRTPAERLNFGREEGDFFSIFVRGLMPTAKTNVALRARVFAA